MEERDIFNIVVLVFIFLSFLGGLLFVLWTLWEDTGNAFDDTLERVITAELQAKYLRPLVLQRLQNWQSSPRDVCPEDMFVDLMKCFLLREDEFNQFCLQCENLVRTRHRLLPLRYIRKRIEERCNIFFLQNEMSTNLLNYLESLNQN